MLQVGVVSWKNLQMNRQLSVVLLSFSTAHTIGLVVVQSVKWNFGLFLFIFDFMKTSQHQEDHNMLPCVGFGKILQTGFPVIGQSTYVFFMTILPRSRADVLTTVTL